MKLKITGSGGTSVVIEKCEAGVQEALTLALRNRQGLMIHGTTTKVWINPMNILIAEIEDD